MKQKDPSFRRSMLLICFGVALYAVLANLKDLWQGIMGLIGILYPILLGLGITLVLNVPVRGFEHLLCRIDKKGRLNEKRRGGLAIFFTILIVPLVVLLLARFILPQFFSAVNGVVTLIRDNSTYLGELAGQIGLDPGIVSEKLAELSQWISNNLGNLAGTAVSTLSTVFSSVATLFMALMLAVYLIFNKTRVKRQVWQLLCAFAPERVNVKLCRVAQMFVQTFSIFISRQCLEAGILGGMLFLTMMLFRLPYAVSIACLTAVLALIPFIGAYLSFFIGFVMIVVQNPNQALIFAVLFVTVQQVEGNVIYPYIVGGSVGLPAYMTLMGVSVGGAVAGIPGMFLIIPVISVAYQLVKETVAARADRIRPIPTSDQATRQRNGSGK